MTEHLDDEILSRAVDGDAPAGALDHLASCPACAGRLAALRMVASAVSASGVQATPDEAARAVTAALDAALGSRPDAAAARAGVLIFLRRRPAALALAAAAVLILVAGISGALRLGRSSTLPAAEKSVSAPGTSRSAGGNAADNAAGNATGAVGATPEAPASQVITGPDMGAQTDAATVAGLVRARLGATAPTPQSGAVAPALAEQTLACAPEAARAAGASSTSPLRLIAPLRWRGQPAVVFVFTQPGPASGLAGVIVRQTDCGALATLPL